MARTPDANLFNTPSAADKFTGGGHSQYGNNIQGGLNKTGGSGGGFGGDPNTATSTSGMFKQRTNSVQKPVDRASMEDFKTLCEGVRTSVWTKRVKAIDDIQDYAVENAGKIKTHQSSFIGLVDAYCTLLQDNNTKVLSRCQQSLGVLLQVPELHGIFTANLTMIVQALTQNLCSSMHGVRSEGEHLMDMLEMCCMEEQKNVNSLVQPVVSQVNLANCRAKPQLVSRLASKLFISIAFFCN